MNSLKFFYLLLFSFSINASTTNKQCHKSSVYKQFDEIIDIIQVKNTKIDSILSGDVVDNISVKQILGPNFKFENTESEIDKLKSGIKGDAYLPEEYISLRDCLLVLKQKNKITQLYSVIEEFNKRKIQLLLKNKELRNILNEGAQSRSVIPIIKNQVVNEKKSATELKEKLQQNLIESEVEISKTESVIDKDLVLFRSSLEKLKLDIVNLNLKYTDSLEKHLKQFDKESNELIKISSQIDDNDQAALASHYERVGEIWVNVVEKAFRQFTKDKVFYQFPDIPIFPTFSKDRAPEVLHKVIKTYNELKELKGKVVENISQMKGRELEVQSTLLLQVNLLRSELFQRMPLSYFANEVLSTKFWNLIKTEVLASPYRVVSFFFTKYLYLKEQVDKGMEGYKELTINTLFIFVLVLLIVALNQFIKISFKYINTFLTKLLLKYKTIKLIKYSSSAWYKIRENYHEIVWIAVISYLKEIGEFSSYSLVFDLIIILLFHRILIDFVILALGIISSVDSFGFSRFKERANQTGRMVGKTYLFYFVSMLFLEGVLGRTYIYSLIGFITLICTFYILFKVSINWAKEIERYLERNVSGVLVAKVQKFTTYIPEIMIPSYFLIVLVIVSIFNLLIYLTEDFGVSKRISANLFKKQIEQFEVLDKLSQGLPLDYLERFTLKSLERPEDFVEPENCILSNCVAEIVEWKDNVSDEHSLVIYGDKGIGKTTLIKNIQSRVDDFDELDTVYAKVPSKVESKEELVTFLASVLGLPEDIKRIDPSFVESKLTRPTVVFLDEAQNVFISEIDGFNAYYALINIVNLDLNNIFWVLTFNKYSWLYLDRAFGKNKYFRNIYQYKGWSDQKIKELIKLRHDNTQYKLSYDVLISATKSEDEADKYATIENKFFKLLWEMSAGNPRAAVYLWTQSLKQKHRNTFIVYVPKVLNSVDFHNLADDTLFILSQILKHENLSLKEITRATNLPIGLCRNSVKVCIEMELVYKDERNRYMIDLKHQYAVIKHLKSKNFVYGN